MKGRFLALFTFIFIGVLVLVDTAFSRVVMTLNPYVEANKLYQLPGGTAKFSSDGKYLFIMKDNIISVWDTITFQEIKKVKLPNTGNFYLTNFPNRLILISPGVTYLIDWANERVIAEINHDRQRQEFMQQIQKLMNDSAKTKQFIKDELIKLLMGYSVSNYKPYVEGDYTHFVSSLLVNNRILQVEISTYSNRDFSKVKSKTIQCPKGSVGLAHEVSHDNSIIYLTCESGQGGRNIIGFNMLNGNKAERTLQQDKELKQRKEIETLNKLPYTVHFSNNGKFVFFRDKESGNIIGRVVPTNLNRWDNNKFIDAPLFSPTNPYRFYLATNFDAYLYELKSDLEKEKRYYDDIKNEIGFKPHITLEGETFIITKDERYLIFYSPKDKSLKVIDLELKREAKKIPLVNPNEHVNIVLVSSDGKKVAYQQGNTVFIVDFDKATLIRQIKIPAEYSIYGFTADDNHIVVYASAGMQPLPSLTYNMRLKFKFLKYNIYSGVYEDFGVLTMDSYIDSGVGADIRSRPVEVDKYLSYGLKLRTDLYNCSENYDNYRRILATQFAIDTIYKDKMIASSVVGDFCGYGYIQSGLVSSSEKVIMNVLSDTLSTSYKPEPATFVYSTNRKYMAWNVNLDGLKFITVFIKAK